MQQYVEEHLKTFSSLSFIHPHGAVMFGNYEEFHESHLFYPSRPSDIWVASYPKCGECV